MPEANADPGAATLRARILDLVREYAAAAHAPRAFVPGQTPVPVSGRVYGAEEICNLVESGLDFWLTTGRFNDEFERRLARVLGVREALTVNSGSSANLLAVAALTSPQLGERALAPGDEVIAVACAFPSTVNPLLQYGLVPVFVDVALPTYNIDPARIEAALTDRTRAIMIAHTLGNPFDLDVVAGIARRHGLWLIEDCCDALGSTYRGRMVGGYGDIGTLSFYPAHHITMGEGGAVFTDSPRLRRILESFRDWGRDCWCAPGRENTCGKRFAWNFDGLPPGYDHKYTYSHAGYNLKITDMQAAVALAQIDRLDGFIAARRANFASLHAGLADLQDDLILPEPTAHSDPSWFGFPITVRRPGGRARLIAHLQSRRIDTRLLFGGNLVRQPYFAGRTFRVSGDLAVTDRVMNDTFWLGVYPGLTNEMLEFVIAELHAGVAALREHA
ncbi:MAG: lipopolysaccharide biosynthesis protein RfbH [Gammaproteobacteria bacterium]